VMCFTYPRSNWYAIDIYVYIRTYIYTYTHIYRADPILYLIQQYLASDVFHIHKKQLVSHRYINIDMCIYICIHIEYIYRYIYIILLKWIMYLIQPYLASDVFHIPKKQLVSYRFIDIHTYIHTYLHVCICVCI